MFESKHSFRIISFFYFRNVRFNFIQNKLINISDEFHDANIFLKVKVTEKSEFTLKILCPIWLKSSKNAWPSAKRVCQIARPIALKLVTETSCTHDKFLAFQIAQIWFIQFLIRLSVYSPWRKFF